MYIEIKHVIMFTSKIWSMCISNIFIHEYMSIWTMKEYKRQDEIPSPRASYLGPSFWRWLNKQDVGPFTWRQLFGSFPMKAAKTIRSLYIGGSWLAESLQFRATWVPLRVSTVWWWSLVELTPRLDYSRIVKIKDIADTLGTAIRNA